MAYDGIDPNYETVILDNSGASGVPNAPSGMNRLINRNGILFLQDDTGAEAAVTNAAFSEGVYTPSAASTSGTGTVGIGTEDEVIMYRQIGNSVNVWGALKIHANQERYTFSLTLPIAPTTFTNRSQVGGYSCSTNSPTYQSSVYGITAKVSDTKASFEGRAITSEFNSNMRFMFNFMYRL